jgi:CDP-diacylglycerol--glycerol-3-phosphate 3-phosphatidyltransferase
MLSEKLGHRLDAPLTTVIKKTFIRRLSPNSLTLAGFIVNLTAAVCFYKAYWKAGAVLLLIAGIFDMLDDAIARCMNRVTEFGGFIDSVIDRYSDMSILMAFLLYYVTINKFNMVTLCSAACVGIALTPYTRARAEIFLKSCNVGIMERAERIIIIAIGSYFNLMEPVLWLLAVFTNITAFQRIYYTWMKSHKGAKL